MKTALIIKDQRIKKGLTQLELANILGVTDRAISKWERGAGLPDASLWKALSDVLEVSIDILLSGYEESKNKAINTMKSKVYFCEKCHNIIQSYIDVDVSCCGTKLKNVILNNDSYDYPFSISTIDNEQYVKIDHPMTKDNYINAVIAVSYDKLVTIKLYPEQAAEARVPLFAKKIYVHDIKKGLYKIK